MTLVALLCSVSALASGGGIYAEAAGGASSTDSTGFVARGTSAEWGIGGYVGNYRHTFRYGKYWRANHPPTPPIQLYNGASGRRWPLS